MDKDKEKNGTEKNGAGQAVTTIVVMVCVIAALASAATWFLFFNTGGNMEETSLYDNIKRYESEQMLDSLKEAMNEYLDTYNPDAFHYSEVKGLRDQLMGEETDWMDAEKAMTIDALRTFLMIHPDGFYRDRANVCMDSLLAQEAAEEESVPQINVNDSAYADTIAAEPVEKKEPEAEPTEHHHSEEVEIDSIFG